MTNYFDKQGNYINCENLSLAEIYHRAFALGVESVAIEVKRPQGEWVGNAFDEHYCKRCGHPALWEEEPDGYYEVQSNFCPECGVKMKKEGAE